LRYGLESFDVVIPSPRDASAGDNYAKPLSDRLQLDYFRRRGPLWSWRGPLAVAVGATCLALVALTTAWPGGRRAYESAPVSTAHAMFNVDCAECHDTRFRTATRLVAGDSVRSVTDRACLRCHDGAVHHVCQSEQPACASCHREHQGAASLTRVDDRNCTACHADLAAHITAGKACESGRTFPNVRQFRAGEHPPLDAWVGKADPGTVRFNHRKHLDPSGLPIESSKQRRILKCQDCHVLDGAGQNMVAFTYDRNCAECHPLRAGLDARTAGAVAADEAARWGQEPLRHPGPREGPGTVRAELRERLIAFVKRHPELLTEAGKTKAGPDRTIPGRRARRPPSVNGAEWRWVELQLIEQERDLFDAPAGCRHCHQESKSSAQRPDGLPQYEKSQVVSRWFPHAHFRHDSHRELDCRQCHHGVDANDNPKVVLMPRLETCLECHNPGTRGARMDCVECHKYHPEGSHRASRRNLTIEQMLGH
jgi:hypothetical protein